MEIGGDRRQKMRGKEEKEQNRKKDGERRRRVEEMGKKGVKRRERER